ncbi:MAG: hypothetical protein RIM84_07350 [Alphaproteobacteria bacterium]
MIAWRTLAAGLLASSLLIPAAEAQSRYQRWNQSEREAQHLGQVLDELDRLVNQAERAKAADPRFLQDLRGLSQKYRAQLQTGGGGGGTSTPAANGPYVNDNFGDGDFAYNPSWQVISGNFQVLSDRKLISAVVLKEDDRKAAERDAGGNSRAGDVIGILSQILLGNQGSASQNQPAMQASQENAEIRTQASIPNAFTLDVDVSSRTTQGAIEIAISQGNTVRPGYGLLYRTSQGLLLIRRGATRNETIAQVDIRGSLFDGLEHNIIWARDRTGGMYVEIDGMRVLRATDTVLQDPFDGLSIVNRGGVHLVHKVKVDRN